MNQPLIVLLLLTSLNVFSQKQSFDITTFTLSAGWKKQKTDQVLQLSKENRSTGAFCVIKVYKAIDANNNAKFDQVKSSGILTVPDNWHIHCTKIESRARTYHAFWICIKGARILNLLDKDAPGSNIYTQYGLAK